MKIACTNHHRQLAGGTEAYLDAIIPELARRGHQVALWHEAAVKPAAPVIRAETFSQDWNTLPDWKPDVIFNHGLAFPEREAMLADIAPVVHFAHNYHGTCISGEKTRKFPTPAPCPRCFGWKCVVQYFPRRCGGVSPRNMWSDYHVQAGRLAAMRRARAVVVASRYIEQEYLHHGIANIHHAPLFAARRFTPHPQIGPVWKLLFAGRMTEIKGGAYLAKAIPAVARALEKPVEVTFAGDGPARARWQRLYPDAHFTGWIARDELERLAATHHLFVMPSVWPEPFGLAGLEIGLPVAAFASGGIPEWLTGGVNGHLASAKPPDANGLAEAIIRCLRDEQHYQALCRGALDAGGRFTLDRHMQVLVPVLESVT